MEAGEHRMTSPGDESGEQTQPWNALGGGWCKEVARGEEDAVAASRTRRAPIVMEAEDATAGKDDDTGKDDDDEVTSADVLETHIPDASLYSGGGSRVGANGRRTSTKKWNRAIVGENRAFVASCFVRAPDDDDRLTCRTCGASISGRTNKRTIELLHHVTSTYCLIRRFQRHVQTSPTTTTQTIKDGAAAQEALSGGGFVVARVRSSPPVLVHAIREFWGRYFDDDDETAPTTPRHRVGPMATANARAGIGAQGGPTPPLRQWRCFRCHIQVPPQGISRSASQHVIRCVGIVPVMRDLEKVLLPIMSSSSSSSPPAPPADRLLPCSTSDRRRSDGESCRNQAWILEENHAFAESQFADDGGGRATCRACGAQIACRSTVAKWLIHAASATCAIRRIEKRLRNANPSEPETRPSEELQSTESGTSLEKLVHSKRVHRANKECWELYFVKVASLPLTATNGAKAGVRCSWRCRNCDQVVTQSSMLKHLSVCLGIVTLVRAIEEAMLPIVSERLCIPVKGPSITCQVRPRLDLESRKTVSNKRSAPTLDSSCQLPNIKSRKSIPDDSSTASFDEARRNQVHAREE